MKTIALILLIVVSAQAQMITQNFGTGANTFSIDFVEIGNLGNAADTTGYGSVGYSYNIGKYEISRDQIAKATAAGNLGITLYDMIDYGGNGVNRPATGLSRNEAARFVNWLNTSKGYQSAYNFTTSDPNGNLSLWGIGQYSGDNQFRHKDAFYFLPNENEWYKAAYGSPSGSWYKYPIGSDTLPIAVSGGTTAGSAVWGQGAPADIDNAGGSSAYDTMGQGGNVWEWTETSFDGVNDAVDEIGTLRGGNWYFTGNDGNMGSSTRGWSDPTTEYTIDYGFRVASVPEPSTGIMMLLGIVTLLGLGTKRSLPRG